MPPTQEPTAAPRTEPASLGRGRYRLISKLGEGGAGAVYKGLDTVLDRPVAVKLLKAGLADEETNRRFLREAQVAARLLHPNIVTIYDVGQDDGRSYLVLEYIEGSDLRHRLRDCRGRGLPPGELRRVALQLCEGLAAAHAKGILHRDVKPENVLLTRDGVAKLSDFGLGRLLDRPRTTSVGVMVGTPAYMPPESALGKDTDARSDLYSFGALLYEMAVGRPPFPAEDALKAIYSHIHDTPTAPSRLAPEVPTGLERLILRLLSKDPSERYPTADATLLALRDTLSGPEATPAGFQRPPPAEEDGARATPALRTPTPEFSRTPPLIGREPILQTLRGTIDAALRGDGATVILTGEAGIGKSRVARELAGYASLRGFRVASGHAIESLSAAPYALWVEPLRQALGAASPATLRRIFSGQGGSLARILPELAETPEPSGSAPTPDLSSEEQRLRWFDAIAQALLAIAKEVPLLLVLEDLNLADPGSVRLFEHVARRARGNRLVLLGTYRDTEAEKDSVLARSLLGLDRERISSVVRFGRLDASDVGRLVAESLGETQISEEFRDLVYEKTGGNPFFVEEVLRSLVRDGVLYRTERGWDRKPVREIEIPETVRELTRLRLDRLDQSLRDVLATAAAIGQEFDFDLLQRVSGTDPERLLTLVEKALHARLLREEPRARGKSMYVFSDRQLWEALVGELSLVRRRFAHLKIGKELEALNVGSERAVAARLAFHFTEGGDLEKALRYSIVAGDQAAALQAHEEAEEHYRTALELLGDEADPLRRADLLSRQATELFALARPRESVQAWEASADLYEAAGDRAAASRLHSRAALQLSDSLGALAAVRRHAERGLALLEGLPESPELAIATYTAGVADMDEGNLARARERLERAVDLARRFGDARTEGFAGAWLGACLPISEKARAMQVLLAAPEALERGHHPELPSVLGNVALHAHFQLKADVESARGMLEKAGEFARKHGYRRLILFSNMQRAFAVALPRGEWEETERLAEETARGAGDIPTLARMAHGLLANVRLRRGDLAECERELRLAESALAFMNWGFDAALWRIPAVQAAMEAGQLDRARERSDAVLSEFASSELRSMTAMAAVMALLQRLELDLKEERLSEAEAVLGRLRAAATSVDEEWATAYADRGAGLYAIARKDWAAAVAPLEEAARRWERIGWPFERAVCLYDLGVALQGAGERAKSAEVFDRALETFTRLGARRHVEKTLARKQLLAA